MKCPACWARALRTHGRPEIFNSDQGSQFTSTSFTDVLKREGIAISMDLPAPSKARQAGGRGRALDNIFVERLWRSLKYEDLYRKGYADMGELTLGLTEYFVFYNAERPHQSLGNRTPQVVYEGAQWGGAVIVDKPDKDEKSETYANNGAAPTCCA